jgi:hypothetical protein
VKQGEICMTPIVTQQLVQHTPSKRCEGTLEENVRRVLRIATEGTTPVRQAMSRSNL